MRLSLERFIAPICSEIWHLFVDDCPFAAAIILWPCLLWLLEHQGLLIGMIGSSMLALGMIVILIAGTMRNRHAGSSK